MGPFHAVHAGKQSREGPQEGHEPAEEDDLSAVPLKEVLADLEASLVEPDIPAIARDQRGARRAPDQITDIVARDGARGGSEHHRNDADLVRRSGIESGRHQGQFAGRRHTHAFERENDEKSPKSVTVDHVLDPGRRKKLHVRPQSV